MPRLKKKYTKPQSTEVVPTIARVFVHPVFLSVEHEAGKYLGVTEWTIRRLIKSGKLTAKKIGRRLIVRRADLDALWDNEPTFAGKQQAE